MTVDRRSVLLGLAGLPVLAACGLDLTRPAFDPDPTRTADPATLRQGGVLRWALDEMPKNFNTGQADMTGYTSTVANALMPTTYLADPQGNLRVNTDYFSAIELRAGEPQTVAYTINPQARWSDGSPITWEDLRAQWQSHNGTNPDFQIVSNTGYRDIASVERGGDDRAAVVVFHRNYADWRGLFSLLYPKSTNADPETFNKGWILGRGGLGLEPITAGPFRINSYDEGQGRLSVVPNPAWWGRKPRLDSIIFMGLPMESQIGALQNDEIDFVDLASSPPNLAIAQNTKGVEVRTGPTSLLTNLTFNGRDGTVCADLRMRRAIAMGIDRERLASTMIGAITANPSATYNLVFPQGMAGYEDHRAELPYDPRAAQAELDSLGWPRRGAFRSKDGRRLSIRIVIPAQTASSANAAKILQQMLAGIGVDLVIDSVASQDFLTKYVQKGDFDITLFSWGHTPYPTDIGSIYGLYTVDGKPDIQQNPGQIGSEKINDLIARMQQELDVAKLRQIGNELDREVARIVHSMSIYMRPANWAVRSGLRNFGPVGVGDTDYTAIGYAR